MSILKMGIVSAALCLFAASAANAQELDYRATAVASPVFRYPARYRTAWYRGHWVRRPIYLRPAYSYAQPVYQYQPPVESDGCHAFAEQVRGELNQLEEAVRERVAEGQLDGNALTTLESARDDMLEDVSDLSAKGYLTDADRGHIERDMQLLRQKFGWA
jgi:hypothetical protein